MARTPSKGVPMAGIDRRTALRGAAAILGGTALGPFAGFAARGEAAPAQHDRPRPTLGPVPDHRDGAVRLWLPDGFQYRSFHDTEVPVVLDDGTRLPGRHDGMAAFRGPRGNYTLIRNHEVNGPGS